MNFVGIIPARYASTRFPGKPLIVIHGKSMVQRVYEQAKKSAVLSEVVVATDDNRIFEHVQQFGGKVMMTSSLHRTGTERCNEVVTLLEKENKFFDVAINIQGDEPYIQPEQINMLALCFNNSEVAIATLKKKVIPGDELNNPNTIKIVTDIYNNAIYFSRSVIPYKRDDTKQDIPYFKHIGIYAYKTNILKKILQKFLSPLVIILLCAGLLSSFFGEKIDVIIIFSIVFLLIAPSRKIIGGTQVISIIVEAFLPAVFPPSMTASILSPT